MMLKFLPFAAILALPLPSLGCESCLHSHNGDIEMVRNVRRMQPGALPATSNPRGPLAWGEINFLHTTDTHGWLEGHLKEQNYGADWGDFVSFTKRLRQTADKYDVDFLLVDTGDLHDGNGVTDALGKAQRVNGQLALPIFEKVDYDLLTIGNHELYLSEIAYETFNQFAKVYGERYLTSNVEIMNPQTGEFEYIGHKYRYFTTKKGLKIVALGVLYDFTGATNVSRVTYAQDMVTQAWFKEAIMSHPVDLFVILGHNPARPSVSGSTFGIIHDAIRNMRPYKPIQFFGGHTHIRDFAVLDVHSTSLESGRYCETAGWLSINGLRNAAPNKIPTNVPQPTTRAVPTKSSSVEADAMDEQGASHPRYFRRYIDWNRLSFEYHAKGSQSNTFDTSEGKGTSQDILALRKQLKLRKLYGCAPKSWCMSCKPFGDPDNIFTVLKKALSATIINQQRSNVPRFILLNTGSVRFDLVQGPFTYDDSFIVSPFNDTFQYLPNVPYKNAKQVLGILNEGSPEKRELRFEDFKFTQFTPLTGDICRNPPVTYESQGGEPAPRGRIIRRQNTKLTPGYTTKDDFGDDGDDTIHSSIPYYPQPNNFQAKASFPTNGTTPEAVDVIFLDFIATSVIAALKSTGIQYTTSDVMQYLPTTYSTNTYLPSYAKIAPAWQKHVPQCPVGGGISE